MDCMCYVSGCNLHGGYNKMLLMVYLGRTLKLMQNGLRTTGIGYNTVKMRFMCMWMFFVNLVEKKSVFWNWNSFATRFSGLQMNLKMILVSTTFWTSSTLFFKHMCMRFQPQPWLDLFSAWCVLFSEAANYFCQQFGCFWTLCKQCVWREDGSEADLFLKRWWIHHQWIHQHDDDVCLPPPLHVAKAKQLKQKRSNYNMLHVHDRQFTFLAFVFFLCGKRIWEFAVKPSCFGEFVFNLLNARRGVKPTPCDVRSATSGCN